MPIEGHGAVAAARFGRVPHELKKQLRATVNLKRLIKLIRAAAKCEDMDAFRQQLLV